jgi:hypothetical protein
VSQLVAIGGRLDHLGQPADLFRHAWPQPGEFLFLDVAGLLIEGCGFLQLRCVEVRGAAQPFGLREGMVRDQPLVLLTHARSVVGQVGPGMLVVVRRHRLALLTGRGGRPHTGHTQDLSATRIRTFSLPSETPFRSDISRSVLTTLQCVKHFA